MKKPVLVIMAAGMGSRYGGLKQIDPVDGEGHSIMDFSMYDAKKAGFEQVVFIIKKEDEAAFRKAVGDRMARHMDVSYAFQELTDLPAGYQVPSGRVKPWGTGHAVLCCRKVVDGPFAVINSDDYYGAQAFPLIYEYLATHADDEKYRYAMVGYRLGNTVTENGTVSRGICQMNQAGELESITERTKIREKDGCIACTEDDGKTWIPLSPEAMVSMNLWGFTASILDELGERFPAFLDTGLKENPLKCEYFLPSVVSDLVKEGKATVSVQPSADKWYGVTYKEDKPVIVEALGRMKAEGLYPEHLWEDD